MRMHRNRWMVWILILMLALGGLLPVEEACAATDGMIRVKLTRLGKGAFGCQTMPKKGMALGLGNMHMATGSLQLHKNPVHHRIGQLFAVHLINSLFFPGSSECKAYCRSGLAPE